MLLRWLHNSRLTEKWLKYLKIHSNSPDSEGESNDDKKLKNKVSFECCLQLTKEILARIK